MSGHFYRYLIRHLRKDSISYSRVFIRRILPFKNVSSSHFSSQFSNDRVNYITKSSRKSYKNDLKPTGNPNVFGNLTDKLSKEDEMDKLPEEEGDKIETTFYDGKVGKRRLSTKQYADMIKKYLEDKKLLEAIDVLEERMIKQDRVTPENYIYNLLIDGCAQVGFTKKAFKLFNDMKKRGLKVTGATYTSLFNACALSQVPGDGLKRATHLKQLIEEKQYEPNRSNYHSMMKAFGRCGDLVTVFGIVDEMISKGIPIKQETFSFLLQACLSDKTNGFRHALLVWRKLRERGVQPNIFSYNLMLRCARDCNLSDPFELTNDLKLLPAPNESKDKLAVEGSNDSQQIESTVPATIDVVDVPSQLPNLLACKPEMGTVVSIKSIVKPRHRLMLLGGTNRVLQQMQVDNVKPDIKTATLLLDMTPGTTKAETELIETLTKYGISLDVDFCNMLIKKRCYRRDYDSAREVVRLISELKLIPNLITYGVLALSCRNMPQAKQFLTDLEDSGFRVNMEILGGLMYAARHTWNVALVMLLMNKVVKEELKVSQAFYKNIEKFKDLTQHHIDLKNQGVRYDRVIDNELFMKLYNEFLYKLNLWSKLIEMDDKETIHPWKQFNKPASASASV